MSRLRKDCSARLLLLALALGILLLGGIGCSSDSGGDDDDPDTPAATITGTAAAGAPVIGTVTVRGANGQTSTSPIRADGSYTVDVTGLTAPYVLWASGKANGVGVSLYSCISQSGRANITPVTHAAMAYALQKEPEEFMEDLSAGIASLPPASDLDTGMTEALEIIHERVKGVLAELGVADQNFDFRTSSFSADGQGADALLEVLDFPVSTDTGGEVVMAIMDGATGETLVEVKGEDITTDKTAEEVKTATQTSRDLHESVKVVFDEITRLYATSTPTVAQLHASLDQYLTNDFIEDGQSRDDMFDSWAIDDDGPSVGMTFPYISIVRPTTSYTYTSTSGSATFDEKGSYTEEGVWVVVSYVAPGGHTGIIPAVFVKDGDTWKWHGDRAVVSAWVEARHVLSVAADGTEDKDSYMYVGADDDGFVGRDDHGVETIVILGDGITANLRDSTAAVPHTIADTATGKTYTTGLVMTLDAYANYSQIVNIPGCTDRHYSTDLGLDTSAIKDSEYLVLGFSSTGNLISVWPESMPVAPIAKASLTRDMFPKLTNVTNHDIASVPTNGTYTVEFSLPDVSLDEVRGEINLWDNSGYWKQYDQDLENLQSRIISYNINFTSTPTGATLSLKFEDQDERVFELKWQFQ